MFHQHSVLCVSTVLTGITHSSRSNMRNSCSGICSSTSTEFGSSTSHCSGSSPHAMPPPYTSRSEAIRPLWRGPQPHLRVWLQPLFLQCSQSFCTSLQPGIIHSTSPISYFSSLSLLLLWVVLHSTSPSWSFSSLSLRPCYLELCFLFGCLVSRTRALNLNCMPIFGLCCASKPSTAQSQA